MKKSKKKSKKKKIKEEEIKEEEGEGGGTINWQSIIGLHNYKHHCAQSIVGFIKSQI